MAGKMMLAESFHDIAPSFVLPIRLIARRIEIIIKKSFDNFFLFRARTALISILARSIVIESAIPKSSHDQMLGFRT
jgi:hypothetical protein